MTKTALIHLYIIVLAIAIAARRCGWFKSAKMISWSRTHLELELKIVQAL